MDINLLKHRLLTEEETDDLLQKTGERLSKDNLGLKLGVTGGAGYLAHKHFKDKKKGKDSNASEQYQDALLMYPPNNSK